MDAPGMWEKILLGAVALLVIFWFRPGISAAMKQSREAENKDWRGLLIPIAIVVLFVMLLISLV